MSTAEAVEQSMADMMTPASFPPILTDPVALSFGAGRAVRAAAGVEAAVTGVHARWTALPPALDMPLVNPTLYSAMDRPWTLAAAQVTTVSAVATALEDFATAVATAKRTFAGLLSDCEQLRADARSRAISTEATVESQRRAVLMQGGSAPDLPLMSSDLPDAPDLTARLTVLDNQVVSAGREWSAAKEEARQALLNARKRIDPALLVGPVGPTTDGLSAAAPPSAADGLAMGLAWYLGNESGNRVFTAEDGFTKRIRQDPTVDLVRQQAVDDLRSGHGQVGQPLQGIPDRELSSPGGIWSGALDLLTIGLTTQARGDSALGLPAPGPLVGGHVPNDIDSAFLGSYQVTAVPEVIAAAQGVAVVRITVTNTTTLASGSRLPRDALNPFNSEIEAKKNIDAQENGHPETTQTITWTETVRWRPSAG